MNFCAAYCAHYGCAPAQFEAGAFRRCLRLHVWPIARLIQVWRPQFFVADQAAIRRLGETSTNSHFQDELRDLRYVTQRDGGFLRRRLGIRVSFAKLERLRARVARATGN